LLMLTSLDAFRLSELSGLSEARQRQRQTQRQTHCRQQTQALFATFAYPPRPKEPKARLAIKIRGPSGKIHIYHPLIVT
jgi:hypothetical protein